ncbi:Gti1/Pac2 family-domain-containing protein [Pisolithus microcarpus]|nr:Gti1/Pac2 family-domain-containing protein [Pisolithus microcarpus]
MQQPTLRNVRVRSTRDALQIFYAVARKTLPLITRRLDAEERRSIVPGNVYVWEERSANTEATGLGMERWTDGMGWGPSRVRDEFLFYHQKEYEVGDDPSNAATPWAQMISMYPSPRSRAASESERLIKQTYSVRVSLPDDRSRGILRKWHLTAYFSQQKLDRLDTVDNIQGVGDVPVPDGWFRSARRDGKSRREDDLTKSVVAKRLSQAPMEGMSPTTEPVAYHSPQSSMPVYKHFPTSVDVTHLETLDTPAARKTAYSLPTLVAPPNYNSTGVRQTTYSVPNGVALGRQHHQYQEAQPVPSLSTYCPSSPSSSSSSTPETPSPRLNPDRTSDKLVPLEYLQSLPQRRRDPVDEELLQRFSTRTTTRTSLASQNSPSTYSQLRGFQPIGHQ